MLIIDETAKISRYADIETSVKGSRFKIGARSLIDSFVKIKAAGGTGDIEIGQNVQINSGCVLYSGNGIWIADNVSIAANCTFAPVNHHYMHKNVLICEQGFAPSKGGIIIEEDVWVGAGTILLDGTILKRGTVIGAGSLISGKSEAYSVYAGSLKNKITDRK